MLQNPLKHLIPYLVLFVISPLVYYYNLELFRLLNISVNPVLDHTVFYISQFGDGMTAVLILLCCWSRSPRQVLMGLAALILVLLMAQGLKSVFDQLRPAAVLENVRVVGQVLRHRSFPSGHSATIFALGSVLAGLFTKQSQKFLLIFICTLIALTRIYIGAHFPVDLWAGALIGWVAADLARLMLNIFTGWEAKIPVGPGQTIVSLILFITALMAALTYSADQYLWFFQIAGPVFALLALVGLVRTRAKLQRVP